VSATRFRTPSWGVVPSGYSLLMQRRVKRRSGFTRLSPKRQITLPLAVVDEAGIKVGEELAVEVDDDGRVIVCRSDGETVGERRRRALERAAGALPGVWPADALDELRNEWR
jgi:bifunctional DNA-binding transcriptional regulator/antitoxin component of YhaV-PrlF toxin-antitoxin module